MAAPFAVLQTRLNRAVFSRLSNADGVLAGVAVQGIFDNAYAMQDVGGEVFASGPVFTLASNAVPANVAGATLVVGGVSFKVVEPMPDGQGVTMLRLRA